MKLSKETFTEIVVYAQYADGLDEKSQALKEQELFTGKGSTHYCIRDEKGQGVIYFGLGEEKDNNIYQTTKTFHDLGKFLRKLGVKQAHIHVPASLEADKELAAGVLEGLYQAEYHFDRYRTEKETAENLTISLDNYDFWQGILGEVEKVVQGVFTARNLVNQPPVDLYPETFAKQVQDIFADTQVEVEVYDKKEIEELGMHAYLSVAKGSDKEPRLIVMKYLPVEGEAPVALVGKGITYDSGGYAIKPAGSMKTMHTDMAGGAAVVGTIQALESLGVKKNVVGVIAATENLINGSAYKNGDLISSMKGTSIEVSNTDAEGRVTLADAIYYAASKFEPETIIDIATLTGAAIVAVGSKCTAMMSNDDALADAILAASQKAAEPTQRLYAFPFHYEQIKSHFADLDNAPGGGAGSITAGLFLEHFTENIPWAHLDIAGPSYTDTAYDYLPKGATGTAVKTIYQWITSL